MGYSQYKKGLLSISKCETKDCWEAIGSLLESVVFKIMVQTDRIDDAQLIDGYEHQSELFTK